MTIYSHRFLLGSCTNASPLTYTVPANYVAVLRSLSLWNNGSGAINFQLISAGSAIVFGIASLPSVTLATWEGRQVLNAGEVLSTYTTITNAGAVVLSVSGYLLTALPPN